MNKYKLKVLTTQISLIILFLFIWELGTRFNIINSFIFSSPSKVIITAIDFIKDGTLALHILITLKEVLISFILGFSISLIISMLMYMKRFIYDVLDPFLTMLNSMPKVALGPIIIIWVGANNKSIITMALLINIIVSIITIYSAFISTDENIIKLFKSFKASKVQILTKAVIPSNIPSIISSLKVNLSLTFIGVIMGEFLVSKKGIGYLILYGTQVFNLNLVITGIVILMLLSYLLYELIVLVEKKIT